MPLTLTEQIDIIEKRVGPPNADVNFLDLVLIESYSQAINFIDNAKTFDESVFPLANSYRNKMTNISSKIFNNSVSISQSILTTLVSKGASSVDITQIQALTQTGWENFVINNIYSAIEYVAQVVASEKTEYDNLP